MSRKTQTSRRTLQLVQTAQELRQSSIQAKELELAFLSKQLVVATFPHSEPDKNLPVWTRCDGNYVLSIQPGYETNPKTQKSVSLGYPFGSIPRLLMFWMTAEALRTKSRHLVLGDSLAAFMRELDLNPENGSLGAKRSDASRLRNQLERLVCSRISCVDYSTEHRTPRLNMEVSSKSDLWWNPKSPEQLTLFESWVELGENFYEALTYRPIPLHMPVLKALKTSPLELDLYAWLVYRVFGVNRKGTPVFIRWRDIEKQIGAGYRDTREFSRHAKRAIGKIQAIYPKLRVEFPRGRLAIYPGVYLVEPRAEV